MRSIVSDAFNSCIDKSIDGRLQNLDSIRQVIEAAPLLRKNSFEEEQLPE